MKFFGQNIYDLISRFRNDVHLEDISTGTIVSGGNLGLDSNNKIVKNTVSGGGDFTLTADSGSDQTISTGNTMDIAGGNAISTVVSATDTVTINHDDTSTQTSVNNSGSTFIQDIEVDTYGHVTSLVSAAVPTLNQNTTGSAATLTTARNIAGVAFDGSADISLNNNAITNGAGYTTNTGDIDRIQISTSSGTASVTSGNADFSLTGTLPVSVTNSGTDITVAAATASDSAKGVVELATTGEADTGTDTGRAVTPAGLKSHVDTRFTYQYVHFIGNANIATNWAIAGTNGPFTHNYTVDTGTNGSSVGSTSFNAARANQQGFVVPFDDAVLVGFYGMIRNNTANNQGALGLFHSTFATFGAKTTTSTFTLQAYAAADQTGGAGSNYKGQCKAVDLSRSLDLTAGDIIMPAILQASEKAYAQFTIVIKTPII